MREKKAACRLFLDHSGQVYRSLVSSVNPSEDEDIFLDMHMRYLCRAARSIQQFVDATGVKTSIKLMKSFYSLFVLVAVVATSYALPNSLRARDEICSTVIATFSIAVGDKTVVLTTLGCETDNSTSVETLKARQSATDPTDVCDELCTILCGISGDLPPTTEDCAVVVDAITILNGAISPTFIVESNHEQQLVYGTCAFFFENFSPDTLEYCWLSLSEIGSEAASACLPPTQPVHSLGLCTAGDGTWTAGVGHS
ncbi:hypothetical protein A0H81_03248 [Grifola frondosa]|uniref:Uncharacterized protein n=1 Tax=Grifola frondosa TaxID=5627 RepID=A0A1C7MIP0_GRIFR|nr:hypothetical protein A0H81_03248 [Grifola frondosa]